MKYLTKYKLFESSNMSIYSDYSNLISGIEDDYKKNRNEVDIKYKAIFINYIKMFLHKFGNINIEKKGVVRTKHIQRFTRIFYSKLDEHNILILLHLNSTSHRYKNTKDLSKTWYHSIFNINDLHTEDLSLVVKLLMGSDEMKKFSYSIMKQINENIVNDLKDYSNLRYRLNESKQNSESDGDWVERLIEIPSEEFFKKWYTDKVFVEKEVDYDIYKHHDKQWDDVENEYFWEKLTLLKIDKRKDITHYFEKKIIDRPLYKVRDKDMTREQELTIRQWCGTKNKGKQGQYIGHIKGLSIFKSYLSNKNGATYHVLPDGKVIEMLDVGDDGLDKDYLQKVTDYLLDTDNYDLMPYLNKHR